MVTIGLPPTGSKTRAKVGRPFGCAGCKNLQPRPVRMGTLNPMPRVKRVPRFLHVKNPCNNSLRGP